jgi:hypothetical protein
LAQLALTQLPFSAAGAELKIKKLQRFLVALRVHLNQIYIYIRMDDKKRGSRLGERVGNGMSGGF